MVNDRDPEACSAEWLDQPIEPYTVARPLSDGDTLEASGVLLNVIETPGHTLGHLSFYAPEERILVVGDLVHADDVAWINPFREGVGASLRALESIEKLLELKVELAFSGHGPPIEDFRAAADAATARYEKWLAEPEKAAWHACKRIFTYALMLEDGMDDARIRSYLSGAAWYQDFVRHGFGASPEDFVPTFLDEMIRSGAAEWIGGSLVSAAPYNPPRLGWPVGPSRPKEWPKHDD